MRVTPAVPGQVSVVISVVGVGSVVGVNVGSIVGVGVVVSFGVAVTFTVGVVVVVSSGVTVTFTVGVTVAVDFAVGSVVGQVVAVAVTVVPPEELLLLLLPDEDEEEEEKEEDKEDPPYPVVLTIFPTIFSTITVTELRIPESGPLISPLEAFTVVFVPFVIISDTDAPFLIEDSFSVVLFNTHSSNPPVP